MKDNGSDHGFYNIATKKEFPYDMEMHMYFYKKGYNSFEDAQSQPGGLVVFVNWLSSGIEVKDNLFANLEKELQQVQSIHKNKKIQTFALASFVNKYYPETYFQYYEGSLTYPPCTESVSWLIYLPVTPITDTLLEEFWKIKLSDGDNTNIRPRQQLNGRQVKTVQFTTNERSLNP
ncbi:carbonic anhydrase 6-like [Belonocnema kinseyi]|uniref:carbonic anhydrase 6-like n=1 Tax=Belonocnema kinseyi TaxID=2817044 RepID=UPI00143CC31F|nr:carbonic anhydrase 6-like [Belonocnema kinseyi]